MKNIISVIIPVYNTEAYLEKCVYSICNQSYKDLEIILVDDGSKQRARDLCDSLASQDSRIKVIHKENGGLSSSRNAGIEAATGEYISFIDSDDYIALDFYETLQKATSGPDAIACSHIVRVDENGVITHRADPHLQGGVISMEEYVRELLLHVGDVSTCSKLFPRTLIGSTRFDETKLNEDLLFVIEIAAKATTMIFTGEIGYYYLVRSGSISAKYGKAIEDMAVNAINVRQIARKSYPQLSEEADRFALFQNMAYLLLVPSHLRNSRNSQYCNAKSYVRTHFLKEGLFNKYLSVRDKVILFSQLFVPGIIASMYQRKH